MQEIVEISGTAHIVSRFVTDQKGSVHGSVNFVYSNFSGVGLTTGNTYRFNSASAGAFTFEFDGAFSGTRSIQEVLTLPGEGVQYILHETVHVTVSEDGVEVRREKLFIECRSPAA